MTERRKESDDDGTPRRLTHRLFMIEKAQKHRILSNFTKNRAFNDSNPPIRQGERRLRLEWSRDGKD
jgi:hypothetical protein